MRACALPLASRHPVARAVGTASLTARHSPLSQLSPARRTLGRGRLLSRPLACAPAGHSRRRRRRQWRWCCRYSTPPTPDHTNRHRQKPSEAQDKHRKGLGGVCGLPWSAVSTFSSSADDGRSLCRPGGRAAGGTIHFQHFPSSLEIRTRNLRRRTRGSRSAGRVRIVSPTS